jgi:hypothetical protein
MEEWVWNDKNIRAIIIRHCDARTVCTSLCAVSRSSRIELVQILVRILSPQAIILDIPRLNKTFGKEVLTQLVRNEQAEWDKTYGLTLGPAKVGVNMTKGTITLMPVACYSSPFDFMDD